MRITDAVIGTIQSFISNVPPETGGILGSYDNELINVVALDLHDVDNKRPCSYYPNVEYLNKVIESWQRNEIYFMGIFHTHFVGVRTLSEGDKGYIETIMNAMPKQMKALYFPLFVLPDRELVCYKATRSKGSIHVMAENIVVEHTVEDSG